MNAVRFLRPAEDEASEAMRYFDTHRPGFGARFQVRTFPFRKFPYAIVYVADEAEIVIVAVAHHRRRPGYWRTRLS